MTLLEQTVQDLGDRFNLSDEDRQELRRELVYFALAAQMDSAVRNEVAEIAQTI